MTTTPLPPLSRDDQRLLLWQAMQRASKVGNATDDKLIVEELNRAGLCIAKDTNVEKTPWWEIADMPPPPTSEQARADLEAENRRLREALEAILDEQNDNEGYAKPATYDAAYAALEFVARHKSSDWPERCQQMVDMARAVLKEQP